MECVNLEAIKTDCRTLLCSFRKFTLQSNILTNKTFLEIIMWLEFFKVISQKQQKFTTVLFYKLLLFKVYLFVVSFISYLYFFFCILHQKFSTSEEKNISFYIKGCLSHFFLDDRLMCPLLVYKWLKGKRRYKRQNC